MRTLDWKIAFAGGAVAGLTIGGFAIAQADDVQAPAVDGIGLPGATAQASPVDPMSSPASTTLVAESARQAAADAVAALADSPVDLDTPPGEASVDGIDTPDDSPVDLDTPEGQISVDGTDTVDSPDAIGPAPVEIAPAPEVGDDSPPDVDSPDVDSPDVDSPDVVSVVSPD